MWSWTRIKSALVNSPVLQFIRPHLPVILETDASFHSCGAVVFQELPPAEGKKKPLRSILAYLSKTFTRPERGWSIYKKELYACYWAVLKTSKMLGTAVSVEIRTDCRAVSGLMKNKPNPMIARWLTTFLALDVKVTFLNGNANTFADLLSRQVFAVDDGGPKPPPRNDPPAPAVETVE